MIRDSMQRNLWSTKLVTTVVVVYTCSLTGPQIIIQYLGNRLKKCDTYYLVVKWWFIHILAPQFSPHFAFYLLSLQVNLVFSVEQQFRFFSSSVVKQKRIRPNRKLSALENFMYNTLGIYRFDAVENICSAIKPGNVCVYVQAIGSVEVQV